MLKTKIPTSLFIIFSIWMNLFAPFTSAQISSKTIQIVGLNGLQFRLSEGAKDSGKRQTPRPVQSENLTQPEAAAIFRRLPPIAVAADDKADFKVRADTLKPPKTGQIIPLKFSADETPNVPNVPTANAGKLEIVRYSPTLNVALATDLSVTFSQPMIAVSAQEQASENVPVILSPQVQGKWRWRGTQTLIFDAETRFPMATAFTATIPKGTKSALGGTLAKDFSWTFTTPPPKVEVFAPKSDSQEIEPQYALMAAKFNQEIDEKSILPKISVIANGKRMPIKLITDEVDGNYTVIQQLGEIQPKHWLAFRTIDLLPLDSEVKVTFEKGLPSAEGSAIREDEQSFSFKTLEPFRLRESRCGYRQNPTICQTSDDFTLYFTRSLSTDKFDTSLIRIEPPIKNIEIGLDGSRSQIYIKGKKKPNTIYTITLSGEAIDFYKRKIGKDVSATFNVGTDQARFFAQGGNFTTLDPNAKPGFSVYTKNQPSFKVKLYAVTPGDYPNFGKLLDDFRNNQNTVPIPNFGKLILDKTVETISEPDVLTETRIALSEALPNKFGHLMLIAEPTNRNERYDYYNQPIIIWLQATNIGLDTLVDYEKLVAFASDLQTGKPISNAEVTLHGYNITLNSITDEKGIANFSQPETQSGVNLIVKSGDDAAILPANYIDWRTYWRNGTLRWFVFDDRKMYRPNEEVSIKGYIRKVTGGKFTDIAELGDKVKSVNYISKDSRSNELARGTIPLNAFGAFDFKLKLPENINLGYQQIDFWASGFSGSPEFQHNFQVQEFRRPEFEVSIAAETPAPFFVGNSAVISAEAKYYTGGFLSNANVNWSVSAYQTTYSPPNHEEYTFGSFIPWWRSDEVYSTRNYYPSLAAQHFDGTTGANGKHRINLDFLAANPARPYTLRATAETQDVNRQTIADTKNFLIHPSSVYVGLRTTKTFIRQAESVNVEAIATDLDGKIVMNAPITIKAELMDWQAFGNNWRQVTVDTQNCRVQSAENAVSCNFTAKQGGTFVFTATVLDEKERPNTSEINVWVAGGNTAPKRGVEKETVELIPDKEDYSPNETAEILVNSPIVPAEGIMTLERNGIIKSERFTMNENSTVLRVPIEESYLPNIHVKIDLIGVSERTNDNGEIDKSLPKKPSIAGGELNLNISKASRKLNVTVEPVEKTIAPGGKTNINIEVKDNLGNAVANSEVALIAVDEGVLALSDYKIQNPLDVFYQQINGNVSHYHSRENIVLGNPNKLDAKQIESLPINNRQYSLMADSVSIDGFSGNENGGQVKSKLKGVYRNWLDKDVGYIISEEKKAAINVRQNFNALAIFSPSVMTDANGKAVVNLKLPDNLTRYRITAVAVTKSKQFGLGESNITAKQSLQVRPSAPRFMNFGDQTELPVVLQNQTDSPLSVNVAIRANNATLTNGNGKKVTVAANNRVEIRFPVATEKAGIARFQIGAVSGEFADAAEIEFPVYTPATTETFATYGTTEANGAIGQTILAPKDVFSQFGGLEITTSSTQLQGLTEAFIYLQNYPFECAEQISSRVLAVAALRDVLTAFKAKDLPKKEEIEAKMKADIERLQKLQHPDGGFSFWRNNDESFPFVAVHVAHALARAKQKGYGVSGGVISKSLGYLRNIESKYPGEYSPEARWAISAYALYVRDLLGDKDAVKAKKLLQDGGLDKLSAESIGWILAVLANDKSSVAEVEAIRQNLLNRVTETAGDAHFVTNYQDGEYVLLSSNRRADAVILEALLKSEPPALAGGMSELIPKIVRGLLAHRIKGRWQSTQENVFVLLALDKYFQTYEKTVPNFVARVWLGNAFAGEQKFAGRTTDSNAINVPMNYLQTQTAPQNLILDKQGDGRLYYRIGMKYAPKNLKLAAADYGFALTRIYEAIDEKNDVTRNADGSWTLKSGARVRVRIQMVVPAWRYHVALVDNLPAGIEIINPELAVSGNNYIAESNEISRRSSWFHYQNLRDNRAEAFTTLLTEGVWNYSYLARATTPGKFVVPPAKAEEMYSPETFGRSKTDLVKIE